MTKYELYPKRPLRYTVKRRVIIEIILCLATLAAVYAFQRVFTILAGYAIHALHDINIH